MTGEAFDQVFAMTRFNPRSPDVLTDAVEEIAAIYEVDLAAARAMVDQVLDFYHYRTTSRVDGLSEDDMLVVIHVLQPFRIPQMTDRMAPVVERLRTATDIKDVLDYGAGGGKDCIIYARMGRRVTYADYPGLITPLIARRFTARGLDVEIKDSRRLDDERRYDLVNCMDVIEHVYDLEYVVADILARLRPGGHFVAVPTFTNSWNGDHIEKNCAYLPFFTKMLLEVGFESTVPLAPTTFWSERGVEPSFIQLYHMRRTRPIEGTIPEERERFRAELYRISRRCSEQVMAWCALALVPDYLVARYRRMRGRAGPYRMTSIADNLFDAYAIRRLSSHQLATLK